MGVAIWLARPFGSEGVTRVILAWDGGVALFLALSLQLFLTERLARMEHDARAQEEGEWTVFALTLAGIFLSLAAIITAFSGLQSLREAAKYERVALVTATLLLSWLMTHVTFALRYAHEFYSSTDGEAIDAGLSFPETARPDYLDFVYFSFVIGMTFQVSDVQITSRKLRRLATLQGLLSFVFNTILLAMMVNLAAGLL